MKNLIMICPSSSQPRIHKRAEQLNVLSNLWVYGFKRKVYEQNAFAKDVEYRSLGYLEDGKYFQRPLKLFKAVRKIRKEKKANSYFYAMSIDCFLIAKLAGLKKGFYEIGDLRSAEKKNSFFSRLERFLISRARGVVITSKYFYSEYFEKLKLPENKFLTIENRLSKNQFCYERTKPDLFATNKIRIGLIGLLRYEKTILMLIDFVKRHKHKYVLECYGDGPFKGLLINANCESVKYHGSFKYPDDIHSIYENIDISFVIYDNKNANVVLALPNKLYESIYFSIPILCATDTALELEVNKFRVGKGIPIDEQEKFDRAILGMDRGRISELSKNAYSVSLENIFDDSKRKLKRLLEKA